MTTIKRLEDNELLDIDDQKLLLLNPKNIYNRSLIREYSAGKLGEARPFSTEINQKVFELEFAVIDTSGATQIMVDRFFISEGWYELTDTDFGIDTMRFTILEISISDFTPGVPKINLVCKAEYGDFVNTTKKILHSQTITSGYSGGTFSVVNPQKVPSTIQLTFISESPVTFNNSVIKMEKNSTTVVEFIIGEYDTAGDIIKFVGERIEFDSWKENIIGQTIILPNNTVFFRYNPGESGSVKIYPFSGLISAGEVLFNIEQITTKQKED